MIPNQHDHVGHMVYEDRRAHCSIGRDACGQGWWLQIQVNQNTQAKRLKWIPEDADQPWDARTR